MKLIVGNWKMHPRTLLEAKKIFTEEKKIARKMKKVKTVICPPHVFTAPLAQLTVGVKGLSIGVQNVFYEDEGARTGENSSVQAASIGATYVILGHSERRALGETDQEISQKAINANKAKLTVILCVGEKYRDHTGEYFNEVRQQLRHSLENFPKNESKKLIIAYEPVWAIGAQATGSATPDDFHEMSILIKRHLVEQFGKAGGFKVPILYGGSVDEKNAASFLKEGGADGLLIGRVSLNPSDFDAIVKLAENIK